MLQIATLHRRGLELEARRAQASQRRVHNTSAERTRPISSPPKGRNGALGQAASGSYQATPDVPSWQAGVTQSYLQSPEDDRSQQL
jgi:hypothetical protein